MLCMEKLIDHIQARPDRKSREWAADFGISRPYLHGLLKNQRNPSLETAMRIEAATGGAVPIASWPNLAAVVAAATQQGAA